jgi:hypothetical protein
VHQGYSYGVVQRLEHPDVHSGTRFRLCLSVPERDLTDFFAGISYRTDDLRVAKLPNEPFFQRGISSMRKARLPSCLGSADPTFISLALGKCKQLLIPISIR